MIAGTLARYLFARQLVTLGWILLGVVVLVAMIDLTETVSRFSDVPGFTLTRALYLVALHLPPLLEQIMPFAILLASMIVLVRLNRKYELVVVRSVGLSAWQFLTPVAFASLLVGVVSLFTLNPLAAAALRLEEEITAQLLEGAAVTGEQNVWLQQTDREGRLVIAARSASADGQMLRGVVFHRIDPQGMMRERVDAPAARLERGTWVIPNATVSRAGSLPEPEAELRIQTAILPETVARRATIPEATAFTSLFARVAEMRRLGLDAAPFTMQLHALLTRPVLFVVMTLIAGTVCLRFARFGQARTVVLGGLGAAFVLYVVTVLARAFGSSGIVAPFAAAWIPILAAALLAASILLRTEDG